MIYLLLVNVAFALGFGLYHLYFRKLTFFQWNRMYLLGMVAVSLLIPIGLFIDLSGLFAQEQILPLVDLNEVMEVIYIPTGSVEQAYTLTELLAVLYWGGVVFAFVFLLWRAWEVRKAFADNEDYVSFSFFRKVFLGAKVRSEHTISLHEQVHVAQGHSYDVLFVEIIGVINWFNPIVYLIRKELKFQHECIADELCSRDKVAYAELLVAHAMRTNPNNLVHGFSNQSFLKKRVMMLFKNKSSNKKKLFYLSAIPVLLIVTCSTLIFNTSRAKDVVANMESHLADVSFSKGEEGQLADENEQMAFGRSALKNIITIVQDTSKKGGTIQRRENTSGDPKIVQVQEGNEIFEVAEIVPEPPGGMQAFRKWIAENYQYPESAVDASVKGSIEISFIVEKDGSLSNLKIIRDLSHGTGEAALNLLSKAPKWSPAIQNGRAVRARYALPIRLDLSVDGQQKKSYRAKPDVGYSRLEEWLASAYKSPRALTSKDLDPYMLATFDVDVDGSLSNFAVRSDLDESFKSLFVNLLKNTTWNPEEDGGIKQKSKGMMGLKLARNGQVKTNYERVEVLPEPRGGMKQFLSSVSESIEFPAVLKSLKQEGVLVEVGFDVLPTGALHNFKIHKEAHAGMAKGVIEAAKKSGIWQPGIIDGQKTVTSYVLPVKYSLVNGEGVVEITGVRGGNMRLYSAN